MTFFRIYELLVLSLQISLGRTIHPPVHLNPRSGERAILIRNHNGDWGIVKGKGMDLKPSGLYILYFSGERAEHGRPYQSMFVCLV